jgi:hypothetical protein
MSGYVSDNGHSIRDESKGFLSSQPPHAPLWDPPSLHPVDTGPLSSGAKGAEAVNLDLMLRLKITEAVPPFRLKSPWLNVGKT